MAKKTAYQKHIAGLTMIHTVLRNGLQSAIRHSTTVTPAQIPAFKVYLSLYAETLEFHHDTEEQIQFPMLESLFSADIQKFHGEHEDLLNRLAELKQIADGEGYDGEATKVVLQQLWDSVDSHFRDEEALATVENLCKIDEKTIEKVDAEIAAHNKKGDPFTHLPMLYHNMEPSKNEWMLENIPWLLRSVLIPYVFSRKHRSAWKFAAFSQ
ncbi:hypothetical protein BC832DRAFT_403709 [Gaertneriomyces semiglobifer]|nr:hypothetical protein BC832DRAFT_403709 [Gaertneriomyces semiglobifer]